MLAGAIIVDQQPRANMEAGTKAKTLARPNPLLLEWARNEAGISLWAAASRLKITEKRLLEWESGASQPTFPQLRQLAHLYRRALAVFFLSHVPTDFRVGVDFRRLPGEVADKYSPALRLDIREVALRRDYALAMLASLNIDAPAFAFTADLTENPEFVGERLRDYLSPNISSSMDQRAAFNAWREAIHKSGALAFQIARTPISEMRAFSLAAVTLPVVAINRRDALAGRIFSMLHEVVHLALKLEGICDFSEDAQSLELRDVERFCNFVAGSTLVPIKLLSQNRIVQTHGRSLDWGDAEITSIARSFGASNEVVLRRLLIHNLTTPEFYESARIKYLKEYAELARIRQAESNRDKKRNIPSETIGLLGTRYVDLVLTSFASERITLSEVSTLLNVRTKHVPKIVDLMASR